MISIDFSNIKSIDTEDKRCKPIDLNKTGGRTEYIYVKSDKIELTQRQLIELLIKYTTIFCIYIIKNKEINLFDRFISFSLYIN